MPTYLNDGTEHYIGVEGVDGPQAVAPGETIKSYLLLDELYSGFVKTADTPYYNPVLKRHAVSLTGAGTTALTIENPACSKLRIMRASLEVDVHLNAAANPDPYPVGIDEIVDIDNQGLIDALHFDHTADTALVVLELK